MEIPIKISVRNNAFSFSSSQRGSLRMNSEQHVHYAWIKETGEGKAMVYNYFIYSLVGSRTF